VVLVGDNPASLSYIKRKESVAEATGFATFDFRFSASISQCDLEGELRLIREHPEIDGVLLQLPVPKGLNSDALIAVLGSDVDADGLHPFHQGTTLLGLDGHPRPCTPLGVMALIDLAFWKRSQKASADHENDFPATWPLPRADLSGLHAVVIGRSALVGKPVSMLLLERNASVSILHSRTVKPDVMSSQADILVAAVGQPELVGANWVKSGAIVIDVGINRGPTGKLVGDVLFDQVAPRCSAITPVPGGVGPMTVAMLMKNTFEIFERNIAQAESSEQTSKKRGE
jgi:methylenetetrahydrofolate dehydrogenase (NADP+)/methenyltetrahydrofolate cyclohydrolase